MFLTTLDRKGKTDPGLFRKRQVSKIASQEMRHNLRHSPAKQLTRLEICARLFLFQMINGKIQSNSQSQQLQQDPVAVVIHNTL